MIRLVGQPMDAIVSLRVSYRLVDHVLEEEAAQPAEPGSRGEPCLGAFDLTGERPEALDPLVPDRGGLLAPSDEPQEVAGRYTALLTIICVGR